VFETFMDIEMTNLNDKCSMNNSTLWRDLTYGTAVLALSAIAPVIFYASKNFTLYSRETIAYSIVLAGLLGAILAICCFGIALFFRYVIAELRLYNSRDAILFFVAGVGPISLYAYARFMSSPFALAGTLQSILTALLLGLALSIIATLFVFFHSCFLQQDSTDNSNEIHSTTRKKASFFGSTARTGAIFLVIMAIAQVGWGVTSSNDLPWTIVTIGISAIIVFMAQEMFGKKTAIIYFLLLLVSTVCVYLSSTRNNDNLLHNPDGRYSAGMHRSNQSKILKVGEMGFDYWRFYSYHPDANPTGLMYISPGGFLRAQSAIGEVRQVGISQSIENYSTYAGKTLTLSARMRGSSSWTQIAITDGTNGNYIFAGFDDADGKFHVARATIAISQEPKELTVYVQAHRAEWVELDWVKLEYGEDETVFTSPYAILAQGPGFFSLFCAFVACLFAFIRNMLSAHISRYTLIAMLCIAVVPLVVYFTILTLGIATSHNSNLLLSLLCSGMTIGVFTAIKKLSAMNSSKNRQALGLNLYGLYFQKSYGSVIAIFSSAIIVIFSEYAWNGSPVAALCLFVVISFFVSLLLTNIGRVGFKYYIVLLVIFSVISSYNYLKEELKFQNISGKRTFQPPAAMSHNFKLKMKPNIYFICAESMHSQKGLKDICDWDYSNLQDDLVARDFSVIEGVVGANYYFTLNSLSATFSMRHTMYLGEFGNNDMGRDGLHEMGDNNVFRLLHNNGYNINLYDTKNYIFRQPPDYLSFSSIPLKKSRISFLMDFFSDVNSKFRNGKDHINDLFPWADMGNTAHSLRLIDLEKVFEANMQHNHDLKQLQFFFIHCGAMHINIAHPDPGFPVGFSHYEQLNGYKESYTAGRKSMIGMIDVIKKFDPDALIVILGDHGSGMRLGSLSHVSSTKANETIKRYDIQPSEVAKSIMDVIMAIHWPPELTIPDIPEDGLSGVTLFPFIFSALNGIPFDQEAFEENISFFPNAKNLKVVAKDGHYLEDWEDFETMRAIPLAE